jgi:hypothetical protein
MIRLQNESIKEAFLPNRMCQQERKSPTALVDRPCLDRDVLFQLSPFCQSVVSVCPNTMSNAPMPKLFTSFNTATVFLLFWQPNRWFPVDGFQ